MNKLNSVTAAKGRLAILAHEEAKASHPGGYSKKQLADASRRVFGGFAVDPSRPIRAQQDINDAGNALAFVNGNYPAGMSDCYTVGLSGGCGADCPVLRRGDCDSPPVSQDDPAAHRRSEKAADRGWDCRSCTRSMR